MSIDTLREQGFPGITMRYEEGGAVQVYMMGGKEVRVGPTATDDDIRAAFEESE